MIARPLSRTRPIPFGTPNSVDPSPFSRPTPSHLVATKSSTVSTAPIARRSPVQTRLTSGQDTTATFMGNGALSVQSSITGRQYRFQGKGHSLFVDQRDVLMLRRIPDLAVA